MRTGLKALVLAAGLALVAGPASAATAPPLPTPKGGYGAKISQDLLGMHAHYLTDATINTNQKFGAVRIWDNQVRWNQINTAPGVYDWTLLDQVVANAEAVGAAEILYVLGSTPQWASQYPDSDGYFGPGSAGMPTNIDDWKNWVRAVAERYKGRITAYQPWNEANLTAMFYAGQTDSAVAMADLTQAAKQVLDEVDPGATFTTASSTVIQTKSYVKSGWFKRYLTALKQRGVKPDTVSVHLYPWLKQGPGNGNLAQREQGLRLAQQVMAATGFKKYAVWDTEMNYGNMRDTDRNQWPKKKYSQSQGAAYLAQTYLFSLTNGVSQVYWYGWDDYGLGVWPTSKAGRILQPGDAYNTLQSWLPGAKNGGCTPIGSITTCKIKRGAAKQYIVFRNANAKRAYTVPASWKVRQACTVLDVCKPIRKSRVTVGLSPLLLTK